jgi:hypothetical protein
MLSFFKKMDNPVGERPPPSFSPTSYYNQSEVLFVSMLFPLAMRYAIVTFPTKTLLLSGVMFYRHQKVYNTRKCIPYFTKGKVLKIITFLPNHITFSCDKCFEENHFPSWQHLKKFLLLDPANLAWVKHQEKQHANELQSTADMKALRAENYPELQLTQMGIKHSNQFANAPVEHGSSKTVYEGCHGRATAVM